MGVSAVDVERLREVLRASVDRSREQARRDRLGEDPLMSAREVCAYLGIARGTWRGYVWRGQAPAADDADLDRPEGCRIPRWRRSTIDAYKAGRKRPWKKAV